MTKRQIYKCAKCGEIEFKQIVKEENKRVYNSVEHVITYRGNFSVGGPWSCLKCGELIPLKVAFQIFKGVDFEGFPILDLDKKIEELEAKRTTPLDVVEEGE